MIEFTLLHILTYKVSFTIYDVSTDIDERIKLCPTAIFMSGQQLISSTDMNSVTTSSRGYRIAHRTLYCDSQTRRLQSCPQMLLESC